MLPSDLTVQASRLDTRWQQSICITVLVSISGEFKVPHPFKNGFCLLSLAEYLCRLQNNVCAEVFFQISAEGGKFLCAHVQFKACTYECDFATSQPVWKPVVVQRATWKT